VDGHRDREAFIGLPYRVHRRDPCWTPPLRRDVRTLLSQENPFFDHGDAGLFLARRAGGVVGRIAAIENRLHNQVHGDRAGFFGFFECVDDGDVAARLLDAASGWLRPRRLQSMRGPVNFSTNEEAGLLVDGFGTPSTLMMPHNPPYYPHLLEAAGLSKAKDLLVYQTTHDQLPARLVEATGLLQRRYGLTVRGLDVRRFEQEVELVKALYNAAWERNWGFVPMTDREIEFLAVQLKPVVVPELVAFAEKAGRAVGFAVALPDLNVALRANPSGRLFPGILRVLWRRRHIRRLRVILLGTLPDWRGKGVDALLYRRIWEEGYRKGFRWAEAGWVIEDNHPMRNGLENMGFEVYKTYRLYDRAVP
jgi:GNAT superfamily N-acetyltransferase